MKWHETSRRCRKINVLGEKFVIRESICGHFPSGCLAWGPCKISISSKNVGRVCFGLAAGWKQGWGWEIALLRSSWESARTKMTLTELKPTLRSVFDLFFRISGKF